MIIGIGVDIVEIFRIARLNQAYGNQFIRRILTATEIECLNKLNEQKKINFIAGRFAGKEALAKAIGIGIGHLAFTDIEIISTGKPHIKLNDKIIKILEEKFGKADYNSFISISHEKNNAIAMVVIEKNKNYTNI